MGIIQREKKNKEISVVRIINIDKLFKAFWLKQMTLYNWDYLYFDKGMENGTIKIREIKENKNGKG